MKSKNDVEVLINGKKYTICGFESDEYMQKVASYINEKYMEFKKKDYYNTLDLELRNVLLAINMADDYFKMKKRAKEQVAESDLKDKMMFDMKHEIMSLQSQLDEAKRRIESLEQNGASGGTTGNNRGKSRQTK